MARSRCLEVGGQFDNRFLDHVTQAHSNMLRKILIGNAHHHERPCDSLAPPASATAWAEVGSAVYGASTNTNSARLFRAFRIDPIFVLKPSESCR